MLRYLASLTACGLIATNCLAADIVDTAVSAGKFKTLAAALGAADLVDALKGKGPFTVFAPTDEAFAKLPAGTVETLLKPENKGKLAGILTYHV
ncbi:MAG: fasciclin domain-containing protein, partial [Pirellula sp.]